MPFTPFHFGLGLAGKAVGAKRFSLILFVALQVVVDLESLYNLVRHRYPVHRFLHTFVGATLLAITCALILMVILPQFWRKLRSRRIRLFAWLLANSLFATWSHVILDGIMHPDVRPFWPLSPDNPLLGIVGLRPLHYLCMLLGFFGLVLMAVRWSFTDSDE